jgi:RNA polymerase sigma-70 factor (ECF subfamily)
MSTILDDVESLYVSEHRRLERIAARKVGAASAADVVQDVFATLWSRTREHIAFTPSYLSQATRYAAISHFRAERRRSGFFRRITEEQYAAPVALPDQVVAARQELDKLDEAIAALPERTRQVFLLNRLHHCTYDEIAAGLGLSYSTVERDIAKAIMACRSCID